MIDYTIEPNKTELSRLVAYRISALALDLAFLLREEDPMAQELALLIIDLSDGVDSLLDERSANIADAVAFLISKGRLKDIPITPYMRYRPNILMPGDVTGTGSHVHTTDSVYYQTGTDENGVPVYSTLTAFLDEFESDPAFNGSRKVTRAGLPQLNVGGATLLAWIENYFFPAEPPLAAISIQGGTVRQIGGSTAVQLNWTVTKKTLGIAQITVAGTGIAPSDAVDSDEDEDGSAQNGQLEVVADNTRPSTAFAISVEDHRGNQGTASATLLYQHRRFIFKSVDDLSMYSDNELSAYINQMVGQMAGSGLGWEYATNRNFAARTATYNNEFIYIAYLASYGDAINTIVVNGLGNNAFSQKTFNYTNSDGFEAPFRIYKGNSKWNSSYTVDVN